MRKLTAAASVSLGTVEPPAQGARPSGNGQRQDIAASPRLRSAASQPSPTGGPNEGHRCWPRQDNGCLAAAGLTAPPAASLGPDLPGTDDPELFFAESPDDVETAKALCRECPARAACLGLNDRICVRQADVTDLPFADATFTLMFSQHVQMNVADKALLYQEARRVLAGGGRLAVWDIVADENGEPDFPVPWADRPEYSHLTTSDRLRTAIATSGFEIEQWNDLTGQAATMMQTLLTLPPSPIGLQAFVPNFTSKAKNLTAALADGRLRAVQGVARAV